MADQETRLAAVQLLVDDHRKLYGSVEELNDGYHSFKELYEHRIQLWIALCRIGEQAAVEHNMYKIPVVWRTMRHSDGELAFGGGWFVLGMGEDAGEQMTYHLPMSYWDQCSFATTLEKAPEYDNHTSADVLERLKAL